MSWDEIDEARRLIAGNGYFDGNITWVLKGLVAKLDSKGRTLVDEKLLQACYQRITRGEDSTHPLDHKLESLLVSRLDML